MEDTEVKLRYTGQANMEVSLCFFHSSTMYLSANFTVVEVHQFVGMGAGALHLHGSIREFGAHNQTVVQVVTTAAPAISRLWNLRRDGTTRAKPQISSGARPRYGVADGSRRQGVDERSLPCS